MLELSVELEHLKYWKMKLVDMTWIYPQLRRCSRQEMECWRKDGILSFTAAALVRHAFGAGSLVSNCLKHSVIAFRPITPQIRLMRISRVFFNYNIVNVHAATKDKSSHQKEVFYDLLDKSCKECSKYDIRLLLLNLMLK
jgi:hypothetical protein